ncbi:TrkH family potassium uptake protein [Coraliomargarita parva]|uniref:TrkH family potassium uptake protein n=1 Tax=Coraliomargarita parva TaxID=3014050 RepID=UPI0022B2B517|nr:potassium transporter TrkG [Coraliomargarita parva]
MRRFAQKLADLLLFVVGVCGLALLVWEIGWPLSPDQNEWLVQAMRGLLAAFACCVLGQWALGPYRKQYFLKHRASLVMVLLALAALFLEPYLPGWFEEDFPPQLISRIVLVFASFSQIFILAGVLLHALPMLERRVFVRMSPGMLLIVTFLLLILVGMCLLQLPNATQPGRELSWLDALFTSTSAVCVTGLIVVDTATEFTRTGQAILLVLFQVGGLGIMTLTYFLAVLAGEGLSVRNRVQLSELMSEDRISSLGSLLGIILVTTFAVEAVGAGLLYLCWGQDSLLWFDALFHSVSAFCNAGFSTFSSNLADPLTAQSTSTHWVIIVLIIMGGLGFPVLRDLALHGGRRVLRRPRVSARGLTTHTRLVLVTTGLLLAGGSLAMYLTDQSMAGEGFWRRLDVAIFNSVTARTAGFNITDLGHLAPAAVLVMVFLMFIGGSPGGMAGGIKTTTFAVAWLNVSRLMRNRRDLEVFRRRLPQELLDHAYAALILGLFWAFIVWFLILWIEPQLDVMDTFFEVFSAFGTVGLSRGITSSLSEPSKWLIILTMFVGRIGIMTFTLAIFRSRSYTPMRLPPDRVIIG